MLYTWIKLQVLESKSLGEIGQVNLCNLISNSGFRLVGLKPRGFFVSIVCGGFPCKKSYALLSISFIFDIMFEMPRIGQINHP